MPPRRSEGAQLFILGYRWDRDRAASEPRAPADHPVELTLVLAPAVPLALLPATVLVAMVVGTLGGLSGRSWLAAVAVVVLALLLAAVLVRLARVGEFSLHRRLRSAPVLASVGAALALAAAAEVVSGSRWGDPVLVMWPLAVAWSLGLLAGAECSPGPAARVGRAGVAVALVVMELVTASQGFFQWRFDRSRDDLTELATELAGGASAPAGTRVGWFEVEARHPVPGCRVGLLIDGWYEADQRVLAWCPESDGPVAPADALGGDWYELTDRG